MDGRKKRLQHKLKQRKEFCYAGEWTAHLNLGTGILKQCYCGAVIQNIFENPDKAIKWQPIGNNCAEPHCHNAHVWLTLGAIPSLDTPSYALMRDRVTEDGSHWLQDNMREFLSGKLKDNNREHTPEEMRKINRAMRIKIGASVKARGIARKVFYSLPDNVKLKILRKLKRSK